VIINISGTPTTHNANGVTVTLPASIPAANVVGATTAIATSGTITISAVAKGDGAAVSDAPKQRYVTLNSIEVFPVSVAVGSQTVQYAISETTTAPAEDNKWKPEPLFEGLEAETDYYVFARSAANANYNAGAAQRSAAITTAIGDGGGDDGSETITMKTAKQGEVLLFITGSNITINWGDGNIDYIGNSTSFSGDEIINIYSNAVPRTITITGDDISRLNCSNMDLTELDVSACPSLEWLGCWGNKLTSLNVSDNFNLEQLYCFENLLTSLNVSANINLKYLHCFDNLLTSLNVSANTNLTELICFDNNMEAAALNTLFGSLYNHPVPGTGLIVIGDNPGFTASNKGLIPSGWTWAEIWDN